jgi:hypothetical protein
VPGEQLHRARRQVAGVGRHPVRALAGHLDGQGPGPLDGDVVVQPDGLEDGGQVVEAVGRRRPTDRCRLTLAGRAP